MSLGEQIVRLRKQHGWTQDDLAQRVGVHKGHVTRWERDRMRPAAKALAAMAEAFGITVDELLAKEEGEFAIGDPQLVRTLHEAQELDEEDKRMVVRFIEALVTKRRMEKAMGIG